MVDGCREHTAGKNVMCGKHWYALPEKLRADVRRETEKGTHSLRARPTREWLAEASKTVGKIRNVVISVASNGKVERRVQPGSSTSPAGNNQRRGNGRNQNTGSNTPGQPA